MSEKKPPRRQSVVGPRDLSQLLKNVPPGAWVALSRDKTRVLGYGSSMKAAALQAQLKDKNEEHPVLMRMPLQDEGLAAGVR